MQKNPRFNAGRIKILQEFLKDIYDLSRYRNELSYEQQQKLLRFHNYVSEIYREFGIVGKGFDMQNLTSYLGQADAWFNERYRFVESNPLLRRLYKEKGCEMPYG